MGIAIANRKNRRDLGALREKTRNSKKKKARKGRTSWTGSGWVVTQQGGHSWDFRGGV